MTINYPQTYTGEAVVMEPTAIVADRDVYISLPYVASTDAATPS